MKLFRLCIMLVVLMSFMIALPGCPAEKSICGDCPCSGEGCKRDCSCEDRGTDACKCNKDKAECKKGECKDGCKGGCKGKEAKAKDCGCGKAGTPDCKCKEDAVMPEAKKATATKKKCCGCGNN